ERNHSQIVSIHDGVNVTGETERERRERDALSQTATGGGSLDVHCRAAGRLPNSSSDFLATFSETFHQPHAAGGFAFSKGSGSYGCHVDVFSVRPVGKALQGFSKIDFAHVVSMREKFLFLQPHFVPELINRFHRFFGLFSYLPVSHLGRVQSHLYLLCNYVMCRFPCSETSFRIYECKDIQVGEQLVILV